VKAADRRGVQRRIRMVEIGLLGLLLLLALRAGHLSVIDRRGLERGLEQTGRELRLAPHRGLIVDRNGAELAVSLDAPSVYATPARVEDLRSTAEQLARALGLRAATVRDRLDRSSRFAFVARWVSPEQAEKVRDLELSGIGVIEEPRRVYPHRGLAAQVVGFANIDGRGVRGMEQQEHDWLSGTPLEVAVERDNRGQLLLPPGVDPGASSGGDVALTLDTVLQADAERTLEAAVRERGARGGLVVTLAPRTGEILALAERPGFDPNRFREVRYTATRSRAFLDALEPGSTLKAFLVAGALEAGAIRPDQQIDCGDGSLRIPGKTIRDRRAFGPLDPAGILRVSSNVGATRIAFDLGAESHFTALRRFGFGTSTGSGFPEESSGLLRPAARWRPVDHATIAYGQGVSVTAIQLAAATAALANGGVWQTPRLIAARRSPGQAWKPVSSGPSHRVVSAATARTVLEMLRGVVSAGGTGSRASLRGVPVAGKTGTAQKLVGGRYATDRYLAWFVGVVPADDPELAIVVMLDEAAGDNRTGGSVAAPLFAEVAASQLRRLGIVTEPEVQIAKVKEPGRTAAPAPRQPARAAAPKASSERKEPAAAPEPRPAAPAPPLVARGDRVLVPDFRGLTPEEVKGITSGTSLRIELLGAGHAVAQDPDPGTILAGSSRIRVRFAEAGG
jgi:cell division protein FtsI (penicillin-binding protein 3)